MYQVAFPFSLIIAFNHPWSMLASLLVSFFVLCLLTWKEGISQSSNPRQGTTENEEC